jgi:hypothetical protein
MTYIIHAKECRCVATANMSGAFLHADMDDIVHVIIEGEQLELATHQIQPSLQDLRAYRQTNWKRKGLLTFTQSIVWYSKGCMFIL